VIADAGYIIALLSKEDRFHSWALQISELFDPPLLTCEEVVAEAAYKLGDCRGVVGMIMEHRLRIDFDLQEQIVPIEEFAMRYADRRPDLADLCLIRMSEVHPNLSIITIDSDFHIYRRNRNREIPLIIPPGR
jgi:hypothetical protein